MPIHEEMHSSIKKLIRDNLVCPACKSSLRIEVDVLSCKNCGKTYPIQGNSIDFTVDLSTEYKQFQVATYDDEKVVEEFSHKHKFVKYGYNLLYKLKDVKTKRILDSIGICKGDLILDVGCNDGFFLNKVCLSYDIRGVGIDISPKAIESAMTHNFIGNGFYIADTEHIPFSSDLFDLVLNFDVLEHLPNPHRCVCEMARVLKVGGKLLIYAVNKDDRLTWHWFLRKISSNRWKGQLPLGHWDDYLVDPDTIVRSLEECALEIKSITFFHSFFTLLFDELLTLLLRRARDQVVRKDTVQEETPSASLQLQIPKLGFRVFTNTLKVLLPILEFLDAPLSSSKHGNGFFIYAVKKPINAGHLY